jgi:hypothetical protein
MASEVKTNKISPATGTDVTLGDASDTFTIPASATLDVNGIIDITGATTTGFPSSGFHNVNFVTATDTSVDLTSGTTLIVVEVQGAGGSSGSMDGVGYVGGTGGAGAYSLQQLTVVDTDTWNVTIGAGGVNGGTISGGSTVFAQASGSSLGSTITASGGAGTANASGAHGDGGAGGTVTNANTGNKLSIAGMNGTAGSILKKGPDTRWGIGGSVQTYAGAAGGAAVGYGSGGGSATAVSTAGGNGGAGLVIIWEYK